jgi:hypothetical protein
MSILAHRGLWETEEEQNSLGAFVRAISNGFGIETDIRDSGSECVIAHNLPSKTDAKFADLIALADGLEVELALNIKSSGLAGLLKSQIQGKKLPNSYFFDHAVPDLIDFINSDLPVLVRASEFEQVHINEPQVKGIWVDDFSGDWLNEGKIKQLLQLNLKLHFVSPELHGYDHLPLWKTIKNIMNHSEFSICTDLPFEARRFFND